MQSSCGGVNYIKLVMQKLDEKQKMCFAIVVL